MRTRGWLGLAALVLAAGCDPTRDIQVGESDLAEGEVQVEGTSLEAVFESAATEYGVPLQVLQSVAWTETRWQMLAGEDELGRDAAFGVMALRGAVLERGADLAGVSVESARTDAWANVRAAAAWMSKTASELAIDRTDVADWAEVVAEYSGIDDFEGRQAYVHEEVYDVLRHGVETEAMKLAALSVVPKFPFSDAKPGQGFDYAGSVWRPSPNYSGRPSGASGKPSMVIIHSCEGNYSGCWSWLKSSKSSVSAHYVVSSNGSEVTQLVAEKNKAWHIAATYDCNLNSKQGCALSGVGANNFTVGIEHAGFQAQSSWSDGLLASSAKLTCAVTKKWNIPRDKFHIVGHGQLQPYNRKDPGKAWPWGKYLGLVDDACDGKLDPVVGPQDPQDPPQDPQDPQNPPAPQPPAPQPPPDQPFDVVVDSNNAANGPFAKCEAPASWTASSSVDGYFNTGYFWRSVGATSDLVEFRVSLAKPRKLRVYAWWPAAKDRSTQAPFVVYDANQVQLDTVYVNQQANGGKWVELGTYNFTAGWNVVALSRWTTGGGVVVADAVRFVEVP